MTCTSDGHCHDHSDHSGRNLLLRCGIAALLWGLSLVSAIPHAVSLAMLAAAYLIVGGDVVWRALRSLAKGGVFDEHLLMTIASAGAFCIGDAPEGLAVMLFYQAGEYCQDLAIGRSRRSIASLTGLRPDSAALLMPDGSVRRVSPSDVRVGDIIVVGAGERVPLDGTVAEGSSWLDTSAMTGESMPQEVGPGDAVISGCVNGAGTLRLRVSHTEADSAATRVLRLIEATDKGRAPAERFITRFARRYTPAVVIAALLLAVLPPLLGGGDWRAWINRALIFLVISCPCALVVSVPLTFFAGIGGAAKKGILVKGAARFEALARLRTMIFDKTGTLTAGTYKVVATHTQPGVDAENMLRLAALAELGSTHPVAVALRLAAAIPDDAPRAADVSEEAGYGVTASVEGHKVGIGTVALMRRAGVDAKTLEEAEHAVSATVGGVVPTVVYVCADGRLLGSIAVADTLRPDADAAIGQLREVGVTRFVMLTGDSRRAAEPVAVRLGIDTLRAALLPTDKVEEVRSLTRETAKEKGSTAFVGDGINDAAAMRAATIGIAMGDKGSDAALEASDIVITRTESGGNRESSPLSLLPRAIRQARHTLGIVRQNIVFALAVKGVLLLLGAIGAATMWEAVFADVGVTLLAILNALRARH